MKWVPSSLTKRALMAGLLAGGGILAASSFAIPEGSPAGQHGCEVRHGQNSHAQREARRTEHLSKLKENLKLAPEQEAAWNTFTRATQSGMHPVGSDRQAMRSEFEKLNTPQRLDRMQAMSEARHARMLARNQAIKAFYAQLDTAQQKVFDAEAMPGPGRAHGHHRVQS